MFLVYGFVSSVLIISSQVYVNVESHQIDLNFKNAEICNTVELIVNELIVENTLNIIVSDELFCEFTQTAVPVMIETTNGVKTTNIQRQISIILIGFLSDFHEIKSKIISTSFSFRGYFLIVFKNGNFEDVREVLKWFWSMEIINVNVVIENISFISVYTFLPFATCNDSSPVLINKYRDGKFSSKSQEFFPPKTLNMNGCPVRVATSNDSQPYVISEGFRNGSFHLRGRDIYLVETLSRILNFSIVYAYVGEEGSLFENGTAVGPFLKLLGNQADLMVADYWLVVYRLKFIDASHPYYSQKIAFMIPPPAAFSSFEKFMRPLDTVSWILLTTCFATGVIVIFILVSFSSRRTQNFVFGAGVQQPYLSMLIAILGGSQHKTPSGSFARNLLMMFLLFCLVMRTIYIGSLYRLIKTKVYHKEVQSIDDIIKREYTIYYLTSLTDMISGAQSQLSSR